MTTIGERLEDARKKKGISIREAAEATKIRGDYLQKFEGNQFDIGLTEIYVRGFLKSYAHFLKVPSDRLLSDYASLGRGESRRQPSREIYGKMDVSIAGPDEPTERNTATPEPLASAAARNRNFSPSRSNLPKAMPIDPASLYRWGKYVLAAAVLGGVIWIGIALFGGKPQPATSRATHTPVTQTQASTQPVSSPDLNTGFDQNQVTVIALADVRIKVAHYPDDTQIFQDWLRAGERKSFPNVPLYLTSSAMENVQIEYKGHVYPTGLRGLQRAQLDFTKQ